MLISLSLKNILIILLITLLVFYTNVVFGGCATSVKVFDGFIFIPNDEYFLDSRETEKILFRSMDLLDQISYGPYTNDINIETQEGEVSWENYFLLSKDKYENLNVNIMTPDEGVPFHKELYVVVIHNKKTYLLITSKNSDKWKYIMDTYRQISISDFVDLPNRIK